MNISGSNIETGIGLGKSALEFIKLVRGITNTDVISAMFDAKGKYLHGSTEIKLDIIEGKNASEWWFTVQYLKEYSFIRFPVIESVAEEMVGLEIGSLNPDSKYWRYIAKGTSSTIRGGDFPNILVEFLVFGYKPKALLKVV